ncbi:iron-sulfur cluster co-chaperone HscB C-terminal domain-containing protein, partial [Wolbachia pipientis]|uniref:iron-sulfur cluster co-chaperone HscB C-terminal domain-containing protein n=1 Tax=Wolbachia pipientis TaxID=955 RepID=UPI0028F73C00
QESMEIREYLLNCDDFQSVTKLVNNKINDCMKSLSNAFSSRNLNNAATQVIRLKYLYKTSEEIKNQRK